MTMERRRSSRISTTGSKAAAGEDGGAKKVAKGRMEAPLAPAPAAKITRKSTAMPPPPSRRSENDPVDPDLENVKAKSKIKEKLVVVLPALTKVNRDASKRQALRDFTNNATAFNHEASKDVQKGKGDKTRISLNGQQKPATIENTKEAAGKQQRKSLAALKLRKESCVLNAAPPKRTASLAIEVVGKPSGHYRLKSQRLPSVSESVAVISLDSDGDDNVFDDEGKHLSKKVHLAQGRKRKASSRTNIAKTAKTMLVEPSNMESAHLSRDVCGAVMDCAMFLPPGCHDIDAGETDIFQCSSFVNDIINYQRARERQFELSPKVLINHLADKINLRAVLTDWLIDVQVYLRLHDETLHLTIALIDRYLALKRLDAKILQLVGITSLFVACKCEEKFTPQIKKLLHLCDDSYSFGDVISMELSLLYDLGGVMITPHPIVFLPRFLHMFDDSAELSYASRYLLDLSLLDLDCVSFYPSVKAAAAVCLANIVRAMAGASVPVRSQRVKVAGDNREAWPLTAQHYSQYSAHDLRPCMLRYAHLLANGNPELKAARRKYDDKELSHVIDDLHKVSDNIAVDILRFTR